MPDLEVNEWTVSGGHPWFWYWSLALSTCSMEHCARTDPATRASICEFDKPRVPPLIYHAALIKKSPELVRTGIAGGHVNRMRPCDDVT